jgi:branched-chain amino acid transport system ATP-binding protein
MLEVKNIIKTFGGLCALDNVHFRVNKHDFLGLIGPNGAGKSVLVNTIAGLYKPDSGVVLFEGRNLVGYRVDKIAQMGIRRTFQISTLFFSLSVMENVLLGLQSSSKIGLWETFINRRVKSKYQEAGDQEEAKRVIDIVGLTGLENQICRYLPYGLQKKVSLANVLVGNAKLLFLDEPLTGLNTAEIEEMMALLRKISDQLGITMVLIEHSVKAILGLCKRIIVLNFGKKIAEGTPQEIREDEEVIRVYLGE